MTKLAKNLTQHLKSTIELLEQMPSLMPKYMTACLFAMHIQNVFQASTQMWGIRKVAYSLVF
jgi:hypothetical protein